MKRHKKSDHYSIKKNPVTWQSFKKLVYIVNIVYILPVVTTYRVVTTGKTGRCLRVSKREVATRWDGSATPEKNQKGACNQGGKFLDFDCV